jgi:hypothetical protein
MSSPCHVEVILELKASAVAKEARSAPRCACVLPCADAPRLPSSTQAELGPALTHKQRAQARTLAIRSGSKSA